MLVTSMTMKLRMSWLASYALRSLCSVRYFHAFHQAKVSLPGGCAIGERRIDLHEKGLKALGSEVGIDHGYVYANADKLVGARILLEQTIEWRD